MRLKLIRLSKQVSVVTDDSGVVFNVFLSKITLIVAVILAAVRRTIVEIVAAATVVIVVLVVAKVVVTSDILNYDD